MRWAFWDFFRCLFCSALFVNWTFYRTTFVPHSCHNSCLTFIFKMSVKPCTIKPYSVSLVPQFVPRFLYSFFNRFSIVFHFLFRFLFHFIKRKVRKSLQCKGLQTFFAFHFVFQFLFRFLICIKELLFYNHQRNLLIRINRRFLLIQIVLNPWICLHRQLTSISN